MVVCAAAACAVGALLVNVAALIRDKPLHGAAVLLLAAVPTLVVGQLWAIGVLRTRMPKPAVTLPVQLPRTWATRASPPAFFGDLPGRVGRPLIAMAIFGLMSALTAFPTLTHGGPSGGTAGCPYRLDNHGSYSCVSRGAYQRAGAAEQRFGAGILLGFFTLQTGAALVGLRDRRQKSDPTARPGTTTR